MGMKKGIILSFLYNKVKHTFSWMMICQTLLHGG